MIDLKKDVYDNLGHYRDAAGQFEQGKESKDSMVFVYHLLCHTRTLIGCPPNFQFTVKILQ